MNNIIELQVEQLPENCYVFKHSTACPVSHAAAARVREASFSLPLYWVNVIEQRSLSNWIAEHYQVEHQSPQLLLIEDGKASDSWSHGGITAEVLKK